MFSNDVLYGKTLAAFNWVALIFMAIAAGHHVHDPEPWWFLLAALGFVCSARQLHRRELRNEHIAKPRNNQVAGVQAGDLVEVADKAWDGTTHTVVGVAGHRFDDLGCTGWTIGDSFALVDHELEPDSGVFERQVRILQPAQKGPTW